MKNKSKLFTTFATTLILGTLFTNSVYAAAKMEAAAVSEAAKVSLNKADAKALMQVNGMSAYKAHAIIAYRNKNGAFKSSSELEKVKGFKRMKPEAMKEMVEHLSID